MNFRTLKLDSYGHYSVPNSNMCLIPFICKSQLLLQTLLLHLPTLHNCFVSFHVVPKLAAFFSNSLHIFLHSSLFFITNSIFPIFSVICECGFSFTTAVKKNTTVASAPNHVDAPLTVYTILNDHELTPTFSKGPCSSSVYPYFHTHLLHLRTSLLSTTPELQLQLNHSVCNLCLLLC